MLIMYVCLKQKNAQHCGLVFLEQAEYELAWTIDWVLDFSSTFVEFFRFLYSNKIDRFKY